MPQERNLKVTFRRVQSELTGASRVLAVFCPRLTEVVDLRQCQGCAQCEGLCVDPTDRDTFVRCNWTAVGAIEPPPRDTEAPSTASASAATAREASLASVMSTPARCVGPDLPLTDLVQLFAAEAISGAPVVDAAGHPIGIVSKTDVLRHVVPEGARIGSDGVEPSASIELAVVSAAERGAAPTVRDVMTHVVFTLQAEASLSRAAALMAFEGVHRIVVVAADGSALGIVSSLDILRWLARKDGYVVPGPARSSRPRPEQPS